MLDHIDLHIDVLVVDFQDWRCKETGATSAQMRERVLAARAIGMARRSIKTTVPAGRSRGICPVDAVAETTLEMAVRLLALSARVHDRILNMARTIADRGGSEHIPAKDIAEAVQYRS